MEIERKFRLYHPVPESLLGDGVVIQQGYLIADDNELRMRRKGASYFMTIKSDGTLMRQEWEIEAPEWVFGALWPHTVGRQIEKTRYAVRHEEHVLDVDVYGGTLSGLMTMECEFRNADEAACFNLPSWARTAEDVTADARYKNKHLACRGLP